MCLHMYMRKKARQRYTLVKTTDRAGLGGIRTHDTLCSWQVLYQREYTYVHVQLPSVVVDPDEYVVHCHPALLAGVLTKRS